MKKLILLFLFLFVYTLSGVAQIPRWITADDTLCNNPNTWIEFKKDFIVRKLSKRMEAKIAADTKYWLWINGKLAVFEGGLKRGPNPKDTYYDVVDIAPYLRKGNNEIRMLLWHFGKSGFSHVNSGKSGIIFDLSSVGIVSDSTWLSKRMKAYATADNPGVNYRLAESNLCYDARLANSGISKHSKEIGEWGDMPWGRLVKRTIPQWRDYGVKKVVPEFHNDGNGRMVTQIRLPYNMQFTPVLDIVKAEEGIKVNIETDHVRGGSDDCVRAEYVTCRGMQHYESFGWMNGDVLIISYPDTANIKFSAIGYRETGYDAPFLGHFDCPDSVINSFWQKAMRTLYVNMRDNYFDCPDRERAQWWGDVTILMGQSFYQLSPQANELMKKAMCELVDWQKADGTLYSPIPAGNWDVELPVQMLAAVSTYGFWYYYLHTGDKETMEYVYPAVRRYLSLWQLDDDGLTAERRGGWSWGDWGTDVDMRLLQAAWHFLALKSAVNMAGLTGHENDVAAYVSRMDSIKTAYNHCWNGYAYRHPAYHGATDDRVQAMAIVSGIADSSMYEPIFNLFHSQEYASPYMEKYVLEALVKMGHGDYAIERFKKRFGPMIADTLHTTLFEGWTEGGYGGGSTNHAWSGGLLTVIAEQICGVRPLKAGWREFEVCPNTILKECNISIPTVCGLVKSSFCDADTVFTLTLTVPSKSKARIVLPSDDYAEISINGKSCKVSEVSTMSFKQGNYVIICHK